MDLLRATTRRDISFISKLLLAKLVNLRLYLLPESSLKYLQFVINEFKMSNKTSKLHTQLKTALRLEGISLSHFAKNLIKPNGNVGVSHTAVIRVAQNREQTPWLRHEIETTIRNSKQEFPEYWTKMALA